MFRTHGAEKRTRFDAASLGTVDVDDFEGLNNSVAQASFAGRIIAERYATPNYESNKQLLANADNCLWKEAHGEGNVAEAGIVEEMTGYQTDGARKDKGTFVTPKDDNIHDLYEHDYGKGMKIQFDRERSTGKVKNATIIIDF